MAVKHEREAPEGAAVNGAAHLVRLPRRETWVDLPEEYAGFKIRVWLNYPRRLLDELRSGEQERILASLTQIVLEHNGWADYDGALLPQPDAAAFWEAIPDELAGTIIALLDRESSKLPNSILAQRRS